MSDQRLRQDSGPATSALVQVTWLDGRGNPRYFQARTLNLFNDGIYVELPEALGNSTSVQVRSEHLGLAYSGLVRTCARQGFAFVIGIQFCGAVRLK